jgi:phage N-6-adenine-methyltransferase
MEGEVMNNLTPYHDYHDRTNKYDVLFSSEKHDWETPPEIFNALNEEFRFTCDVCALPHNAKCSKFYTPQENGLVQKWEGVCWMNPPYGREIQHWVKKAYEANATVVCLLPARTDTVWWHDYVMKADEIRFIRGRIKFVGAKNSAPFPSAIVVFRGKE